MWKWTAVCCVCLHMALVWHLGWTFHKILYKSVSLFGSFVICCSSDTLVSQWESKPLAVKTVQETTEKKVQLYAVPVLNPLHVTEKHREGRLYNLAFVSHTATQLETWQKYMTQSLVLTSRFSYFLLLEALPKLDLSSFKADLEKKAIYNFTSERLHHSNFSYLQCEWNTADWLLNRVEFFSIRASQHSCQSIYCMEESILRAVGADHYNHLWLPVCPYRKYF